MYSRLFTDFPVKALTPTVKIVWKECPLRCIVCIFLFLALLFPAVAVCDSSFPHYPTINNNVKFWENIYSTYSLSDAVIHDSDDLSRIYEIVPLLDPALPGANRINRLAQKQIRHEYQKLLRKIARTQKAVSAKEKRVANLFTGHNRYKKMEKAAGNVRSQTGQKERFKKGVKRSRAYMKEMKRIFRAHRLPEELAYLPHVESSFNTAAYSKFGAAGMWQFTRATGVTYMTIDYVLDERLDPIIATKAAAAYLKKSYQTLSNWPMAITSYNYGLSGMMRAKKAKGSYENIFSSYNKGHFKFASKNFYSEFLAALNVAKKYEKKLGTTNPTPTRYFTLPGYVHIQNVSNHFKISKEHIQKMNPALRPSVLSGEKLIPKGYSLRLPAGNKSNKLIAVVPATLFKTTQKRSQFHRVKKGETAGSIAILHKVPLKTLIHANSLDRYAKIFVKQKLRIPNTPSSINRSSTKREKSQGQSQPHWNIPTFTAQKKNRPKANADKLIPQKDPTLFNVFSLHKKNSKAYGYIIIQPDESLGLYAGWLGVTSQKLLALNNFTSYSTIEPGQQLLLVFENVTAEQFEDKRLDFLQETEDIFFRAYTVIGKKSYKVNTGDTLWDLCYNKFGIPLWLLERYNSSLNLSRLRSSQELTIPIIRTI